jgi:rubredoxin
VTAHCGKCGKVGLNADRTDRVGNAESQDERGSLVLHWESIKIAGCAFYFKGCTVSDNKTTGQEFKTWMCLICGWVYDEEAGLPEEGIAPGTRWEDVPMNWTCPECGARKEDFEMVVI